jgi:N-acetyl-gamma-glutamyl-phosphate reductase
VGTPFCDVGWQRDGDTLVVGFALDNLLKGAASQAVQNLNRALGLPEASGLLPRSEPAEADPV